MSETNGKQTVLVMDDSEDIHQLVGARLRSERIQLLHAYNATNGLQKTRDALPDLILLDLDMPDADGLSVCRQLKSDEILKDIPVIFLTGTIDTDIKVKAFDLGAVDYVTKPFDSVELRARVRSALRTKRYHDLLVTKAQIDALTGLWNRGHLDDQLAAELAVTQRHGHPVSLVMLDIDHFKPLNDTHGHPFGDVVIQQIAGVLNEVSRESDVVCRYGGEEFVVILRHTPVKGAEIIAERLRREIEALEFESVGRQVTVTASLGVAGSDGFENDGTLCSKALLKAADNALYQAKADGRNRVVSHA
ncbi:MAG: diguanylate cyclase [Pseudohongiellaceae bacterium]